MRAFFLFLLLGTLTGCQIPQHEVRDPHLEDLGSDQIPYEQLSQYPDAMQTNYVVFAKRCSKCHTLARPINARFVSRKFWTRYVNDMRRRAASNITHQEVKQIVDFLVYDSEIRKTKQKKAFRKHREKLLKDFKERYPDIYELEYEGDEELHLRLQ